MGTFAKLDPLEDFIAGQTCAQAEIDGDYDEASAERRLGVPAHAANLVTSLVAHGGGMHCPVLDVDLPVHVVPSSTPGHHHVYINKVMTWENYRKLLEVLAEVGIVEPGYLAASLDRGHTAVRLPWVRKPGAGA